MVEYGLPGDPLMREPIREAEPEALELHPDWKPVPHFTVREEPFGLLVCRLNWSVPVTLDAKPLIDAIDGKRSLTELHRQFGDNALEFVGYLYREGCLNFE